MARWNAIGSALMDVFDDDIKKSGPYYFFATFCVCVYTLVKCIVFLVFLPISLPLKCASSGDTPMEKAAYLLIGFFAGSLVWLMSVANIFSIWVDLKNSEIATSEQIVEAMQSTPCMKQYLPRYLAHKNEQEHLKKLSASPLTVGDIEKATKICSDSMTNEANVRAQKTAMGQVK